MVVGETKVPKTQIGNSLVPHAFGGCILRVDDHDRYRQDGEQHESHNEGLEHLEVSYYTEAHLHIGVYIA